MDPPFTAPYYGTGGESAIVKSRPDCRRPHPGIRCHNDCYNGAQVYMRKLLFPICGALFLLLTGCSEPTKTTEKKKEAEKLEPATGQSALYKMYQVARSWAPDAQVLKMNSLL